MATIIYEDVQIGFFFDEDGTGYPVYGRKAVGIVDETGFQPIVQDD
jgi:hypothetical protein